MTLKVEKKKNYLYYWGKKIGKKEGFPLSDDLR